ncbi:MAG: hypothetical protein HYW78_02975 [Parcubacteria group bacterium]|nr:hypothetical protein [Parcubacteria group bacterium]
MFVFAIFFTAFTVLLYAPFGGFINTFNGVTQQIEHGGILDSLIGASIISFFAGPTAMRFIGIFLALGTLVFFLQSKKYVYAYTLPLVVLFFFGTRWFGSWYALWILPFFILFLNPPSFIVLSMILFLMPAVTPFFGSLLSILTIIMFIIVYKVLYYPRYISLRSLFLKKDYAA